MLVRRAFFSSSYRVHSRGLSSSQPSRTTTPKRPSSCPPSDALGLPLCPPWSVHDLITSYPSPTISDAHLMRLHGVAALVPPKPGSSSFHQLKQEMEELARLVEAVRTVPEGAFEGDHLPDGRPLIVRKSVLSEQLRRSAAYNRPGGEEQTHDGTPSGQALLKYAPRTQNGFYLVDSARTKT